MLALCRLQKILRNCLATLGYIMRATLTVALIFCPAKRRYSMKRKLIISLLATASAIACAFGLTACGEKPHEHDYSSQVVDPTCTEQGYTTHTCACGDSYVDTYVNALGHSFTNYVSDGNATCTQDGTKTAT